MALSILFARQNPGQVGELVLDATLSDSHNYTNEVTHYPREEGLDITDNVRTTPDTVTINGFITNTPVAFLQFLNFGLVRREQGGLQGKNNSSGEVKNRVQTSLETLLDISGRSINGPNPTPKIIDVVTGLRVYRDMMFTNLSINRDADNSRDVMKFTASLIHVEQVSVNVAEAGTLPNVSDDISDQSQSNTKKSKATPDAGTADQTEKTSFLYSGIKAIGAVF